MSRPRALAGLALLVPLLLLASCATAPETARVAPAEPRPRADTVGPQDLASMRELLRAGLERLDEGLVSDGIKRLVSVLAERQRLGGGSEEAAGIARAAETELGKLGSSLALEPDSAWLDAGNNQVTGETLNPRGLMPSVIVTIRQAGGRSLVSNAPVRFEFVEGGGLLTPAVNTNEFGQANCPIASFDNPAAEQVVRASLVYSAGGFTYAFRGVERDFVYTPPLAHAVLLVLERSPLGASSDPFVVDPVFQELKRIRYDFSLYNGSLSPEGFMRIYEGDPAAIASMALEKPVSYLVVLLNDCTAIRQLELNGRKYNLFISDARATLRVLRKADGKLMYQSSVERSHARGTHGQGGSREKAAEDVLRATSTDLAAALERDLTAISTALRGH